MSLAFLLFAPLVAAIDGPDLVEMERHVARCDSGAMTKVFGREPERRRAAMIAIFTEQQAIVGERRALAQRRYVAMSRPAEPVAVDGPAVPPRPMAEDFELAKLVLDDRQQALDDARMLGDMRDKTLDTMRQHYLIACNARLTSASK